MSSEPVRRTLRVELDLVPESAPIRGEVREPNGVEHEFSGWLELIQVLEHVRKEGAEQ